MHKMLQDAIKNDVVLNWLNYSKASRYMASRCTDLDNARFLIGSKKIWGERIYIVKTLSYTFFDDIAFALLSNSSCMNFELHEFFHAPQNVHLKVSFTKKRAKKCKKRAKTCKTCKNVHLKCFWTLLKNVHCQGPCILRPCISRPYCISWTPRTKNSISKN